MPTVLESLLDPIRWSHFREQYYGQRPLLIRGHPGKFARLFTWSDLNLLLNTLSYPNDNVHVAVPGGDEAVPARDLIERCRAGATMIIAQLDLFEPKVGQLVRSIEAETGEPAFISLFLSQPGHAAFERHYDRHDTFVLQVDGHKAWSVYDRTVEKPVANMPEDSEEPPNEARLQCELAPGDVLYVPRGYWHEALAQRGMSLHLTLGVRPRTGIDFLTWLVGELRSDVRFRHELPLSFDDEPAELREERLREHAEKLGEILQSRLADAETLRAFHQYRVLSERDAFRFKFPAQLFEAPGEELGVKHFSRPARQRCVLEDGPTADLIALSVWGRIFHFPKTARPLVEFIVAQTAFTADEARARAGGLSEEEIRGVLDPLLREGILDAAQKA